MVTCGQMVRQMWSDKVPVMGAKNRNQAPETKQFHNQTKICAVNLHHNANMQTGCMKHSEISFPSTLVGFFF